MTFLIADLDLDLVPAGRIDIDTQKCPRPTIIELRAAVEAENDVPSLILIAVEGIAPDLYIIDPEHHPVDNPIRSVGDVAALKSQEVMLPVHAKITAIIAGRDITARGIDRDGAIHRVVDQILTVDRHVVERVGGNDPGKGGNASR